MKDVNVCYKQDAALRPGVSRVRNDRKIDYQFTAPEGNRPMSGTVGKSTTSLWPRRGNLFVEIPSPKMSELRRSFL